MHRFLRLHSAIGNRQSALLLLISMLLLVARIIPTYSVFNDTADEPYHLGAGLCMLETGKLLRGFQHPPLPRIVAALPVRWSGVRDEADANLHTPVDDLSAFNVGHAALFNPRLGYWQVLTRARAAMLIFPLIAIFYVYRVSRWFAGRTAGALAALFFSTDPTLLGHATWIATDVPACAGYLAAIYHGLRFVARPSLRSALIAGIALGLGVACKFNVAIAGPAIALAFALHRPRRWRQLSWLAVVAIVAFLTLWATYFFDVGSSGLPMPMFFRGLAVLRQHITEGHAAYLNGEITNGGWLIYFPEAIALKSPLATLLGLSIALVLCWQHSNRRTRLLLLPLLIYLIPAMIGKLDIGVRHVLPAIGMIYPLIAVTLRRVPWLIATLALIALIETGVAHPDYLSYFNVAVGGSNGGQRYLLDSNLDWGQDLERARVWLETNAHGRTVSINISSNPRLQEWPAHHYTVLPADAPLGDLLLVSRNSSNGLYGGYAFNHNGQLVQQRPLIPPPGVKPIATIGTTIDVYEVRR